MERSVAAKSSAAEPSSKEMSDYSWIRDNVDMNETRLDQIRRRSDRGDPAASYELAHFLATRPNAEKHRQECLTLLQSASAKGESRAQYALATWYLHGVGVIKSFRRATALLLKAARQGHPL